MTAFAQFIANMTDQVSHVKCFEDASWMTWKVKKAQNANVSPPQTPVRVAPNFHFFEKLKVMLTPQSRTDIHCTSQTPVKVAISPQRNAHFWSCALCIWQTNEKDGWKWGVCPPVNPTCCNQSPCRDQWWDDIAVPRSSGSKLQNFQDICQLQRFWRSLGQPFQLCLGGWQQIPGESKDVTWKAWNKHWLSKFSFLGGGEGAAASHKMSPIILPARGIFKNVLKWLVLAIWLAWRTEPSAFFLPLADFSLWTPVVIKHGNRRSQFLNWEIVYRLLFRPRQAVRLRASRGESLRGTAKRAMPCMLWSNHVVSSPWFTNGIMLLILMLGQSLRFTSQFFFP